MIRIVIDAEDQDEAVIEDVINVIETTLPYMLDNVMVRSNAYHHRDGAGFLALADENAND